MKRKPAPRAAQKKPKPPRFSPEEKVFFAQTNRGYEPASLVQKWAARVDENQSVERFVADLRAFAAAPELDDPATAAAYAGRFMMSFTERFQRLVEAGKLDDVLPRLPGLPVIYSPQAGKGAGEWESAARLFAEKRVGSESAHPWRESDAIAARNPTWRNLAWDTVWIIQHAIREAPEFRARKKNAESLGPIVRKISPKAQQAYRAELFRVGKDELLLWPDWLDACHAIPLRPDGSLPRIADAPAAYLRAARAVIDSFFADPHHPYAEPIIASVKGVREDLPRAQAVAEARKNVLEAVRRM